MDGNRCFCGLLFSLIIVLPVVSMANDYESMSYGGGKLLPSGSLANLLLHP